MDAAEFNDMVKAAAERVGSLSDVQVAEMHRILRAAQTTITAKLADAPSAYNQWFYSAMQTDVDRLLEQVRLEMIGQMNDHLQDIEDLLKTQLDEPLQALGLTVAMPHLSRQMVEKLTGFSPGQLISGVTHAAKQKIIAELQAGMLGTKSPWEVQQAIAANLQSPGIFKTIAARAETIWRTEATRTFNILANERYKYIGAKFPGRFKKAWLHSRNPNYPRQHHIALGRMPPIDVDEKFLVGSYPADGPHDSVLPASETIRCGCTTRIFLIEGGVKR